MSRKKKIEDLSPQLDGIDWSEFENEIEWKPKPVKPLLSKVRKIKQSMRECITTLLNCENENNDTFLEVICYELIEQAMKGNIKSTELIVKLLGEIDDKQKIDLSIPEIKFVIDSNKDGIRDKEKMNDENGVK